MKLSCKLHKMHRLSATLNTDKIRQITISSRFIKDFSKFIAHLGIYFYGFPSSSPSPVSVFSVLSPYNSIRSTFLCMTQSDVNLCFQQSSTAITT
ncbi:CLUMA_CG001245, isoform A [Clunio marinus]|uniref:CLUMA_CG001245, isoform A n=1 Tax=Clunio marinus TaxID=568069 RepID=A0A1J1HJ57_9DIPT|nr:CLUMA_CG001245, isoform A [Clunio marinus]